MRVRNKKIRKFVNSMADFLGKQWIAFPMIPDDDRILFFRRDREDFGFLSNFYRCEIQLGGMQRPHSEMYYQSNKSENPGSERTLLIYGVIGNQLELRLFGMLSMPSLRKTEIWDWPF